MGDAEETQKILEPVSICVNQWLKIKSVSLLGLYKEAYIVWDSVVKDKYCE